MLACLLATVTAQAGIAADERGRDLFRPCIACHGASAEGNRAVRAPMLAALPAWYLARQLENFRNGSRGGAAADPYSAQMARMAQQLWDTGEINSVAAHVASLPPAVSVPTVRGKAKRGEAAYAGCTACHGADAAGNAELGAPPLRSLDDWYVVEQLNAFRVGTRGSHSDDTAGQLMRAAAATLTGETVAVDIAAYLTTLRDDATSELRTR